MSQQAPTTAEQAEIAFQLAALQLRVADSRAADWKRFPPPLIKC
jgi:hypothetical protein